MRVMGHGVDLVELAAIEQLRSRRHFDERCFTARERSEAEGGTSDASYLAGRFAAKEAVLKALGTGLIDGISWTDVEITAAPSGAPKVILLGGAAARAAALGVTDVFVSISHTDTLAMASAMAVSQHPS